MNVLLICLSLYAASPDSNGSRPTRADQPTLRAESVSAAEVRRQPLVLDLTLSGSIYTFAPAVNRQRVSVRTAKATYTLADIVTRSRRPVGGALKLLTTTDIRKRGFGGLVRPGNAGRVAEFRCSGFACDCSGDADCNDLFTSGLCGDIALCDDRGCWCLRL